MILAAIVIAFCAGVLSGVGFGIWYERGQRRREEDDLFRARMRAYHELPSAIVTHAARRDRQIRAAIRDGRGIAAGPSRLFVEPSQPQGRFYNQAEEGL